MYNDDFLMLNILSALHFTLVRECVVECIISMLVTLFGITTICEGGSSWRMHDFRCWLHYSVSLPHLRER